MKKYFFVYVIALILVLSFKSSQGQSQEKIYAVMLLKFARGIQWPNENQSDRFVIGIMNYTPLSDELRAAVANVKKGRLPITIKELNSPEEASNCDILFVPAFKSKTFPALLKVLEGTSTLVVTNKTGLANLGSAINFVLVNGKINYEINCKVIEKRGMKVSTDVKNMGIILP